MSKKKTYKNLKPRQLTTEEATEMGRKGGIASVKARRKKKAFKKIFNSILELDVKDKKLLKYIEDLGVNEEITNKTLLAVTTFKKAVKGDMRAFEIIRDTVGEKPKDSIKLSDERENSKLDKILEQLNDED